MPKHTPGPWQARKGRANNAVYIQDTQHVIAVGIDDDEDARLIAAAPELLAECIAAHAFIRDDSQSERRRQAVLIALEAAIAKAESK